jgi:predicted GNAT family acetyltransferase
MSLWLTSDATDFAARAERFLAARIERNVLATVLQSVQLQGPGAFGPAEPLLAAIEDDETHELTAVAMRTPPWPMLAVGFDDAGDARALLERWLERDPEPSGVSAIPATARAIAQAYTDLSGGRAELEFDEAMFALSEVLDPPRPAAGALRQARAGETELLIAWERGFNLDSGMGDPEVAAIGVAQRLAAGTQYVWALADGTPVSTVAHSPAVSGVARIGPVYTPPERRAHGYASAATAALARKLLRDGAEQVMLFTDLANPTSNSIYASIGFVRIGDWEQHRFQPPGERPPD